MKRLKLIKDCLTNKDYGKSKAKSKASYNHKAGKRNYNSDNWKALCHIDDKEVAI